MSQLLPENYLSNTTFNEEVLLDSLTEIKKCSYSYIEEVQRDLVGYHKFDFKFSDFKIDRDSRTSFATKRRYVLNVPKQLLPTASKESYKKSEFFMKELTIKEIAQNYKIFPYSFLVFIDGDIYVNVKIVVCEDITRIILHVNDKNTTDGIEPDLYQELLDKDANVTIFFIPNSLYANYATNKYVVSKFKNAVPVSMFSRYGETNNSAILYSTVSKYTTGARSLLSSQTTLDNAITIGNGFERALTTSFVDLGVVSLKYFDRIIEIPEGGDYFELPIRKHVVPLTSFMAFYEENGFFKFYHDLDVSYHYPNIYKVNNNTKPLKLHVFYREPMDDTHFINEMALYYRFFGDTILEKYKNGTIPDAVKNYKPKEFPVSIKLFEKSAHYCIPIDYKTDTMNKDINLESKNLSIYLKNMMKNRRKMRVHVKNTNLDTKLRTDTSRELPNREVVTFNEERYVFIFSKYFVYDFEMRFFIDGLFYSCDQEFHDDKYYYFYIPTTMIKPDTIIEIEKYRSLQYDFDTVFDKDMIVNLSIDENPCIASDVVFINDDGDILKEDLFHFIIEEDGKEIEIESTSHKPLSDKFKIKLMEKAYIGMHITVLFRRLSAVYEYKVNNPEDADKPLLFKTTISRHPGHIRIYRNGRLLPPDVYDIRYKTSMKNHNVITLTRKKLVGDVYHIEFNPDVLYSNYYTAKINKDGLLDFGGRLNKPFDLRWFDVYLNGFKLDERNFDILTPRYAIIKGVKSVSHLLIMERNWTNDIFKFNTTDEEIIPPSFVINSCTDDDLLHVDPELQEEIDKLKEEIDEDDTIPELLPEAIEDISDPVSKLMASMLRNVFNIDTFINPDIDKYRYDLPQEIEEIIKDANNIVRIHPRVVPNLTTQVVFNPDRELFDPDTIDEEDGVIIN